MVCAILNCRASPLLHSSPLADSLPSGTHVLLSKLFLDLKNYGLEKVKTTSAYQPQPPGVRGDRRAEYLLVYDIRTKRRLLAVASNGDTRSPGNHWRLIDTQIQETSAGEYNLMFYVYNSLPGMPCEIQKVRSKRLHDAYGTICHRSIGRPT